MLCLRLGFKGLWFCITYTVFPCLFSVCSLWWRKLPYYEPPVERATWQGTENDLQPTANEELSAAINDMNALGSGSFSDWALMWTAAPATTLQPVRDPKAENSAKPHFESWSIENHEMRNHGFKPMGLFRVWAPKFRIICYTAIEIEHGMGIFDKRCLAMILVSKCIVLENYLWVCQNAVSGHQTQRFLFRHRGCGTNWTILFGKGSKELHLWEISEMVVMQVGEEGLHPVKQKHQDMQFRDLGLDARE